MFARILVALDGSARALDGLDVARRMAAHTGASLLLAEAVSRTASVDELDMARRNVQALAATLSDEGIAATGWVVVGSPEGGLPWTAAGERCDLMVAAAQPRHGLESLTHPRLTDRLAAHAPVPVLIWPERAADDASAELLEFAGSPVLVPLDGSETSERAVAPGRELALIYGRPLWLLRVVSAHGANHPDQEAGAEAAGTEPEDERVARAYLAGVRSSYDFSGSMQLDEFVRTGDPAREILRAVSPWPTAIIVMSTRGRGALARALLGSVTTSVLRHATVPVLVIPPAASAEPAESVAERASASHAGPTDLDRRGQD